MNDDWARVIAEPLNDLVQGFNDVAAGLGMTPAELAGLVTGDPGPRTELRTDAFGWVRLDPSVAYRLEARVPGRLRRVEPTHGRSHFAIRERTRP